MSLPLLTADGFFWLVGGLPAVEGAGTPPPPAGDGATWNDETQVTWNDDEIVTYNDED